MSVPMASGTWKAATAAADPPLLPPGTRPRSQGLPVGPNAECSVDEPIANSSMLVLPGTTAPAASSRSAMCASYGPTKPSRIRLPAVDGWPRVTTRSLSATGIPSSGGSARTASGPAFLAAASRCVGRSRRGARPLLVERHPRVEARGPASGSGRDAPRAARRHANVSGARGAVAIWCAAEAGQRRGRSGIGRLPGLAQAAGSPMIAGTTK